MQGTQAQMRTQLKDSDSLERPGAPHPPSLPDLSDSFQEFVRPLLEKLPRRFRLRDLRSPLLAAAAVWNEVIATKGNVDGAVADVAEMIEEFQEQPVSPSLQAMLEALAARKSSSFGNDDRLVVELEVHRQGADVRVIARTMAVPAMNAVLLPDYVARRSFGELAVGDACRRRAEPKRLSCSVGEILPGP